MNHPTQVEIYDWVGPEPQLQQLLRALAPTGRLINATYWRIPGDRVRATLRLRPDAAQLARVRRRVWGRRFAKWMPLALAALILTGAAVWLAVQAYNGAARVVGDQWQLAVAAAFLLGIAGAKRIAQRSVKQRRVGS